MTDAGFATSVDLDQVIDDLMESYRICQQTSAYLIAEGGHFATLERLKAFDDCAEINLVLANFLLRGSEHSPSVADLALAISVAGAESIQDVEHDDGQLRVAYAACQRTRHRCLEIMGRKIPEFEDDRDETVRESFPASDPPPPPTEL